MLFRRTQRGSYRAPQLTVVPVLMGRFPARWQPSSGLMDHGDYFIDLEFSKD